MRLFLAAFMSVVVLATAGLGGYELVWQAHKIVAAQPQQDTEERQCDETKSLSQDIMKNRHLGFLSTSIDDKGQVYMYFLSNQTGEWMMLDVMPGGRRACVFMQGTDWQFIMPQRPLIKVKPTLKQ